jgi:hypothetical protein
LGSKIAPVVAEHQARPIFFHGHFGGKNKNYFTSFHGLIPFQPPKLPTSVSPSISNPSTNSKVQTTLIFTDLRDANIILRKILDSL